MSFENRWMIVGRLTAIAPLHIGNGEATNRAGLINTQMGDRVDVNAVYTNKDCRATIPGSTLKGNLRSWAKRIQIDLNNFDGLFGSEDSEKDTSVGGKIEIYDAAALAPPIFSEENLPAYWDVKRCTGVMAGVAIDRRTRTASHERLFHHEFVPPGVSFNVTITGQNLTDNELEDLLFVLTGFNHGGVALGASGDNGRGAMAWELTDLRRLNKAEVASWIDSGAPAVGYSALTSLPGAERQLWVDRVNARHSDLTRPTTLALEIELEFEGHFLVNDPSRTGRAEEGKTSQAPLIDVEGRLLLPASSFRGALRSQAEKILRTIRGEQAACYPDGNGPRPACAAVYGRDEIHRLCSACKVFGAPGWKSPISFTDFITMLPVPRRATGANERGHQTGKYCTQEFVAVDRFTGGAAHGTEGLGQRQEDSTGGSGGKKFNAASVYKPQLHGKMKIDLDALELAGASGWALGLLALVIRDLVEGDIKLGFGAAKGYGAARARINLTELPPLDSCPNEIKKQFNKEKWTISTLSAMTDKALTAALRAQVEEIQRINPAAQQ